MCAAGAEEEQRQASFEANSKDIEKQITARITRHLTNPVFMDLGQRLNKLREKYADIQQSSLDFIQELLELAKDTVVAEKAVNEVPREERGKAALTELFEALKTEDTPIIVDNIVDRIDEVVRGARLEAGNPAIAVTIWSAKNSGGLCMSISRSATTTSSRKPSSTSASTTDSRPASPHLEFLASRP